MITDDELKKLMNYTAQEGVAVSLYLDAGTNQMEMRDIETKDLIKNARKELNGLDIDRNYLRAAEENLDHIRKFISSENFVTKHKSAAIFVNSMEKFFKFYWIPVHLKSRLVVDTTFHVRPLLSILEEHNRLGLVLIDSKHARLFEIYIGEILEHLEFPTAARNPKKPLLETFMKREKRLALKKEEDIRSHLSLVAELLKTHFLMRHFDKLVIGAKKPLGDHLARLLYPKLHENLIAVIEIDIHAGENEILSRALGVETEFELNEENKLLRRMMNEIEKNGYAVKGLKRVMEAAQDYSLQTVAIADDLSRPGLACSGCGMPHLLEESAEKRRTCMSCGGQLVEAADVVNHIVDEARRQNASVRHVRGINLIGSLENIAAIIKFKKNDFAKVEEAVETGS